MERVQKRATERISGLKEVLNGERLKALNLPSLLERRLRRDMGIMCEDVSVRSLWKHLLDTDETLNLSEKNGYLQASRANSREKLDLNSKNGWRQGTKQVLWFLTFSKYTRRAAVTKHKSMHLMPAQQHVTICSISRDLL